MNILDIHTHFQPPKNYDYEVIQNCYPSNFDPKEGAFYSLGIHPWYVESETFDFDKLYSQSKHKQVLAIGEAGLDKYSKVSFDKQEERFISQILISEELEKPLIIHGVKSEQELLKIKKEINPKQPWILHGFRGGKQQAERYVKHGFFISIGLKYNNTSFEAIPLQRLFLETDDVETNIKDLYREIAPYYSIDELFLINAIRNNIHLVFS